MAKKTFKNTEMSSKKCSCGCGRGLKRRIAEEHPKFKYAYECFRQMCIEKGMSHSRLKETL